VVGVTARPLWSTNGVHIASVNMGDPGEFRPEYMSPALVGLVGDVVYGSLGF
jgi:hypothetical protein